MKKLNFKIAVLLCMMMCLFSVVFGQVPSGYTIVKTHNDDITWYEVRDSRGDLGAVYNGKVICTPTPVWEAVSYSCGYFLIYSSYWRVYDRNGNQVTDKLFDDYVEIGSKLYLFKAYDGYYNESLKKISDNSNAYYMDENLKQINGIWYLKLRENRKYGIKDLTNDEEIIAPDFDDCDCMGGDLFSFKMNGYWGVLNRQGKVIIPLDRHYTSIAYSRTLKTFSFTKETETAYYKGECNASGVQTSIEKTGTKSKPKQQTQQPKQETKPQQPRQETVTPTPQPQPQPQPEPVRQPQPFQVWQRCFLCGGSGQCPSCFGSGYAANGKDRCINCNGTGKCSQCAGHGGQNVIEYH